MTPYKMPLCGMFVGIAIGGWFLGLVQKEPMMLVGAGLFAIAGAILLS